MPRPEVLLLPAAGVRKMRRHGPRGEQIRHAALACRERPVKGDRVEIVIDAGGATRNYEVTATRAGRRVEVVTRRGAPVRTARFMASRVLALVEHPADRRARPGAGKPSPPEEWAE